MPSRLGIKSDYSFLYGVHDAHTLAERVHSYGAGALGITDRNGLYGLHAALEACKETGLLAPIGVEFVSDRGSLFAFALNGTGYGRLCELLSVSSVDINPSEGATPKKTSPKQPDSILPWDGLRTALFENAQGLALASFVPDLLCSLAGRVPRLYAALGPGRLGALRTASRVGLPILALDDAVFLDPLDRSLHEVLRAIGLGKTVGSLADTDLADEAALLLPQDAVDRHLASWPEALCAADALAEECTSWKPFGNFVFPEYGNDSPSEQENPIDQLRERVYRGAEIRYGELSDGMVERIEYELDIIERKAFASYFLFMDDIVAMGGRTCGRGSGAASIVSYSLFITHVDPLKHQLYFERFLNMARPDPPDLDVDFAWDERDELIRRVIARFGPDHCARVANHNRFRFRSALRELAKAHGYTETEITAMEHSLAQNKEPDAPWDDFLRMAARLEGHPRGLSMHCGGLVITPSPIRCYAPVVQSAQGYPLLAWEKEGTEAAGLVKLDLLGNRSLAVIRDTIANLAEEGIELDFSHIRATEDLAVQEALAKGDSMGVFYIESPAMRQLQRKTGRGDFDHIVIHSSIIRPAANRFIKEYVRRLKGASWKPLHPRLERILDESYGILCYQEDVSKVAVALASFNEEDADALRKIIAKKAGGKRLELFKERFYSGCIANNVDTDTVDAIWSMMLSFDGYSFCKPHSASYAMVSFQSAYLRVYHGAQFMAAVLSNQGGYYHPQAYISEIRRMGLNVAGPDVNTSEYRYHGSGTTVTVGLMAIAGLSRAGAEALIGERHSHGTYKTLEDVCKRVQLHRDDVLALVAAGTFDSLVPGLSRPCQVRKLLVANKNRGGELFPPLLETGKALSRKEPGLNVATKKQDKARELRAEFSALGFLRERHPLYLWSKELAALKRVMAADMETFVDRRIVLAGWPITRKEIWTKDGLAMNFISFEDESAIYETVLFPEVYETYRTLLFDLKPFIVIGTVKDDQGALCLELSSLKPL